MILASFNIELGNEILHFRTTDLLSTKDPSIGSRTLFPELTYMITTVSE
jgi:hypothetical protein